MLNLGYIYNGLIFNNIKRYNNKNFILYKEEDRQKVLNFNYLNSNFLENLHFSFIFILNSYIKFFSFKAYIKLFFIKNTLVKFFNKSSKNILYNNSLLKFDRELLYLGDNINNFKNKELYRIKFNNYKTVFNFKILAGFSLIKEKKKFKKINYKRITKSIVYIIIKNIFLRNNGKKAFLDFYKGL